MNLETTFHIWKEGSQYVAHAMPLDVISSGPTPDSARQALDEAVRAFVLTAAEAGTLEQVLEGLALDQRTGAVNPGPLVHPLDQVRSPRSFPTTRLSMRRSAG